MKSKSGRGDVLDERSIIVSHKRGGKGIEEGWDRLDRCCVCGVCVCVWMCVCGCVGVCV